MKVSIAMCTYNGRQFLREQLASIAGQNVLPDELVICDDGSIDTTAQIVFDFERTAPFAVRFVQNSNRLGITKNFEKAIMLCRGSFIALADQDDVWKPEKLGRSIRMLESDDDLAGVFSDAELIDDHSALLGRRLWSGVPFRPRKKSFSSAEFVRLLLRQDVVTGATVVFRSRLRDSIVPIPPSWMHDAWLAWMLVLHSSLGFIREPLMHYRIHPAQQVGIAATSPWDRLHAASRVRNTQYSALVRRFEDLRDRLAEHHSSEPTPYLRDFDRKIQLLKFQTELATNRLTRVGQIITALPSYLRYTRGLVTISRDILV